MGNLSKLLLTILSGCSDRNVRFDNLVWVLRQLGFSERIKGSHHIFWKMGVREIINLQPNHDGMSKPYQVKQVREIIINYRLGADDGEI